MLLNRGRLYRLLLAACFSGYIWLYYSLTFNGSTDAASIRVCLFKTIYHIPCPSCGSTRALIALLNGHISESLAINPLGAIVASIMVLAPAWIFYDYATKGQTLFNSYNRLETFMKKPVLAMPLILLVLLNWFWNISKGL